MEAERPGYFWGTFSLFGLIAALGMGAVDQASKLWLLYGFELGGRGMVSVLPFLDFVLVWNRGVSYGLFEQDGALGQWMLFALKMVAVVILWIWLARARTRLTALCLGLIIGGAIGNGIDRLLHGAVVDFIFFHIRTTGFRFEWYVFNLADVAIVAGVIGLLYESFIGERAAKAP